MLRLIIFVLLFSLSSLYSTDFKAQKNSEPPFVLKTKNIGGRDYFSLKEIQKKIFKNGKIINNSTIVENDLKIFTSQSSFYISAENAQGAEIAQLSAPALLSEGELYIPALSFLNALEALRIFETKIEEYSVKILTLKSESDIHNDAPKVQEDKAKPKFVDMNKEKKAQENKKAIEKEIERTQNVETDKEDYKNFYTLPKNLIRKEIKKIDDENESINELYIEESPSIASTEVFSFASPSNIENVYIVRDKNSCELRIKSRNDIEKFFPAELNGMKMTITLPNAILSKSFSPSDIKPIQPIKHISITKVKSSLALNVDLSEKVTNSDVKRRSANEIAYSLTLGKSKKIEVEKEEDSKDNENDLALLDKKKASDKNKKKWDLDVIALDAGHGGKDGGALGVSGYKEKDFTLKIVLLVKEKLKDILPKTKVILTRSSDVFVELYRRTQIANENKCKLFISVHANSMPTKPNKANGFETYILKTGRNDDAIRVADKENSVIKYEKKLSNYKELSPDQLIIATMAQASFVKFSEKFANIMQKQAPAKTGLFNRGVNQAGFFVLVGASMPNALIEAGFLSNSKEEKYLSSKEGQEKIAESIAQAIKKYADSYKEAMEK